MSEKTVNMKTNKTLMNLSLAVAALLWGVGTSQAQTPTPGPTTGFNGGVDYDVPNYANSPLPTLTGSLTGIRVANGGCGFTGGVPPTLIIDRQLNALGNPVGTRATAHAVMSLDRTSIASVVIDYAGAGYLTVPNVTVVLTPSVTCQCPAKLVAEMGISGGGLRKFVDKLPGLGAGAANGLGQYIPVATADTTTYSLVNGFENADYYEIGLVDYREQMHSDLPAQGTHLRGYVQLVPETFHGRFALMHLDGTTPVTLDGTPGGPQAYSADRPSYLGPIIVATRNKPTRIKFVNLLKPNSTDSDLFIPVDTTLMGSGMGGWALTPHIPGANGQYTPAWNAPWTQQYLEGTFPQSRATLHLHGGLTPWISDGTPHQWTVPVGDDSFYQKGVSTMDVPDMAGGQGMMTFYWPNQQSGRLMFYHDHAWGTTRLNVYVGEAAGYLLIDPSEQAALATAGVNDAVGVPLVIQDKTFVWGDKVAGTGTYKVDPSWAIEEPDSVTGDLWWPHVYMANQNPADLFGGANPLGRWDYGPWFWPPQAQASLNYMPTVSTTPESFMDTPLVNGTAYPYVEVPATKIRFRILNACNDRFMNLQLYQADPGGFTRNGFGTEVAMVPATPNDAIGFPPVWQTQTAGMIPEILDNRPGGIPDPRLRGPAIIQIGTEGGLLPGPVLLENTPVGYEQNKRNIVVLNVTQKTLFIAPAERADVIIDFSNFSGKTLILYNDSPAPVPAGDPRLSYYTGNEDFSETAGDNYQGGAPSTLPGYGPNIRTIMQIRVAAGGFATAPVDDYDTGLLSSLRTALPTMFKARGERPVIPEPTYDAATGSHSATDNYAKIQDNSMTWFDSTAVSTIAFSGGPYNYGTPALGVVLFAPVVTLGAPDMPGGVQATAQAVLDGSGNLSSIAVVQWGSGYGVPPAVTIEAALNGATPSATATLGTLITKDLQAKAIHELFDTYGRMNSVLGVELPFTDWLTQTTIPYQYIDPTTETIPQGETQMWKITHNGVDSHVIHFHLVNVQVVNRVGWDGAIRKPDANELGWKESVRMNPLEDVIVATRAIPPTLPWALPDSNRVLDPAAPPHSSAQFTGIDPLNNAPVVVFNDPTDFGWEYVWHCHILGHEENDMMRPLVMQMSDLTYVVETVPPLVSAAFNPVVASGWYKAIPDIDVTANDGLGVGVASVSYQVTGAVAQTLPGPVPAWSIWTGTGTLGSMGIVEGTTVIDYWATDARNNGSPHSQISLNLDTSAPLLFSVATIPILPTSGFYNTDVTVTFTFTDAFSGMANGTLQIDTDAVLPFVGGSGIVTITTDGDHVVNYTATDIAGNTLTGTTTIPLRRYTVGPVINWGATTPALPLSHWYTGDVLVDWTATAQGPLSMVSSSPAGTLSGNQKSITGTVLLTGEGGAVTTPTTPSVSATDNAGTTGNTTTGNAPAVQIDRHAPTLVGGVATRSPVPNLYGWNIGPVTLTYTATDAVTGITGVSGVASQVPASGFIVSAEGINPAPITLTDVAGNSAVYNQNVKIDLTAPVVAVSPAANAAGWYNLATLPDNAIVSITVSDALSGVLSASRSTVAAGALPGVFSALTVANGQAVYNLTVGGGTGGASDVYINASDRAFKTIANYLVPLRVDLVAPTSSATAAPASPASGWNKGDVAMSITAVDTGGSGLKSIAWSDVNTGTALTDQSGTPATSPVSFTVSTEGVHTVRYQATDVADNVGVLGSLTVRIDKTAPTGTIGAIPASMTAAATGSTAVTFSGIMSEAAATALKSGMTTVRYNLTDNSATPVILYSGNLTPNQTTGAYSVRLSLLRTAGKVYTFTLTGTDRAGNAMIPVTKTVTVN